jgi:hypothetical protein
MQDTAPRGGKSPASLTTHRSRQVAQAQPKIERLRGSNDPVARAQREMGAGAQSDCCGGLIYSA